MFLSIDGGDGAGKSTQVELLCEWLRQKGREVVTCRDPGSTRLGESVRQLLLARDDLRIDRTSEMFLYMAARSQMTEEVIRPALDAGEDGRIGSLLVVERGLPGTRGRVGRGNALGGGTRGHRRTDAGTSRSCWTCPRKTPRRESDRELDRMEQQGDAFHARVREGFSRRGRANVRKRSSSSTPLGRSRKSRRKLGWE